LDSNRLKAAPAHGEGDLGGPPREIQGGDGFHAQEPPSAAAEAHADRSRAAGRKKKKKKKGGRACMVPGEFAGGLLENAET